MINKCIFIGNLGKDPECRTTENGHKVAGFSIACSEKRKKKGTEETEERTEWINIICWDSLAELVSQYLRKGMQVYVEGAMRTRSYEGNDGIKRYVTEIYAQAVKMLGRKPERPPMPDSPDAPQENLRQEMPQPEDDLPF